MALWPELSLVAGDAVAGALRVETGVVAELSHPNDVLAGGRKVAGSTALWITTGSRKSNPSSRCLARL